MPLIVVSPECAHVGGFTWNSIVETVGWVTGFGAAVGGLAVGGLGLGGFLVGVDVGAGVAVIVETGVAVAEGRGVMVGRGVRVGVTVA